MTATQVTVDTSLAPAFQEIEGVRAGLQANVDSLTKQAADANAQVGTLTASNAALTKQVADLQAQLASSTKPVKPLLGFATGGSPSYPAAWSAGQAIRPVTLYRAYEVPSSVPLTFEGTHAGKVVTTLTTGGPKFILLSLKPSMDNSQDAAVAALAKSTQAALAKYGIQVQVCFHHEPENKSKNITPAQFVAAWTHNAAIWKANAPDVRRCAIFMTYTLDIRTPGTNDWLAALAASPNVTSLLDEVDWDGYANVPEKMLTGEAIFGPDVAYCNRLLPKLAQGVAEWGVPAGFPNRPATITDIWNYFVSSGMRVTSYFNESGTTGEYALDGDPAAIAAFRALS